MKRSIIAGNWKMNKTQAETTELIQALKPLVENATCEVVVCVPFTDLNAARKAVRGSKIKLGAQNVHWAEKGAFTGEVSAEMLREMKVDYVIVGHSERRQYFGETDETVNKRVKAALKAGLKPIICVGETLDERETGKTNAVVTRQINAAFQDISKDEMKFCVVAYEPIWAIGTGKTATKEEANETIGQIRKTLRKIYGKTSSNAIRIQYGGSMNPKNATELMQMPDIDGGLIGGASLNAEDFAKVVNY